MGVTTTKDAVGNSDAIQIDSSRCGDNGIVFRWMISVISSHATAKYITGCAVCGGRSHSTLIQVNLSHIDRAECGTAIDIAPHCSSSLVSTRR